MCTPMHFEQLPILCISGFPTGNPITPSRDSICGRDHCSLVGIKHGSLPWFPRLFLVNGECLFDFSTNLVAFTCSWRYVPLQFCNLIVMTWGTSLEYDLQDLDHGRAIWSLSIDLSVGCSKCREIVPDSYAAALCPVWTAKFIPYWAT